MCVASFRIPTQRELTKPIFRPSATYSRIGLMECHACVVIIVMEDPSPPWLADTPPPSWLATPPRDGWLGRSASALTKRTCFFFDLPFGPLPPVLESGSGFTVYSYSSHIFLRGFHLPCLLLGSLYLGWEWLSRDRAHTLLV